MLVSDRSVTSAGNTIVSRLVTILTKLALPNSVSQRRSTIYTSSACQFHSFQRKQWNRDAHANSRARAQDSHLSTHQWYPLARQWYMTCTCNMYMYSRTSTPVSWHLCQPADQLHRTHPPRAPRAASSEWLALSYVEKISDREHQIHARLKESVETKR